MKKKKKKRLSETMVELWWAFKFIGDDGGSRIECTQRVLETLTFWDRRFREKRGIEKRNRATTKYFKLRMWLSNHRGFSREWQTWTETKAWERGRKSFCREEGSETEEGWFTRGELKKFWGFQTWLIGEPILFWDILHRLEI